MPTLGNTLGRLQQQMDTSAAVQRSDNDEEDVGVVAVGSDDEVTEVHHAPVPSRGRPPTRRLQRGGTATRGVRGHASGRRH